MNVTAPTEAAISIAVVAAVATRPSDGSGTRATSSRATLICRMAASESACATAIGPTTSTAPQARILATVGSFRVVAEHDLGVLRDEARKPHQSIRHLEDEGLIRRSPLGANDRAVVLTDRGRDLLEANRSLPRDERTHEPRQELYAGLRKPRELTHDVKVYRAYARSEKRIRARGVRSEFAVAFFASR